MLIPPAISDETIMACLHDHFGLRITRVTFLPIGYVNSAVYRLTADSGSSYFLKLRHGNFSEISVTIPAFLRAQGIRQVVAPLMSATNTLWVHEHGFDWILYPFFEGTTGFEAALSKPQWITLGQSLKAIHAARLPDALAEHMPCETFSPIWRAVVKTYDQQVQQTRYDDPIAVRLAAFWQAKRDEIQCIVERAEQLAHRLETRPADLVVCHSDLHAGNVLIGADGTLGIVDWDEPILAPKERDLMFIGGGVGGIWNSDQEARWFYRGYGHTEINRIALSYYRYERIVADIAAYAEQIFGMQGSVEERRKSLGVINQFSANNVVDIAHRTYGQLV